MAKVAKPLKDVLIGDTYYVGKVIERKDETATQWVLHFNDGTSMIISKTGNPAIEIGQ